MERIYPIGGLVSTSRHSFEAQKEPFFFFFSSPFQTGELHSSDLTSVLYLYKLIPHVIHTPTWIRYGMFLDILGSSFFGSNSNLTCRFSMLFPQSWSSLHLISLFISIIYFIFSSFIRIKCVNNEKIHFLFQPAPGKARKPSARTTPKTSTTSSSSIAPPDPVSTDPVEDPLKRAETLREKAMKDGELLKESFWANLSVASSEIEHKILSEEEKKKLPVGISLSTAEENLLLLEKAKNLFSDEKFDEAEKILTSCLINATLDEEILGQLYHLRGKIHYQLKKYMTAIRDLTMAKNMFVDANGDNLFFRMRSYIDLLLPNYATLDYDALVETFPEYPNIKSYKSKVSGPMPHDFQKLIQKLLTNGSLPITTSLQDLVKVTIVIALSKDFDFEELGKFLFMIKTTGYKSISTPQLFGAYLRDVFAATDMEDISEVFTHFIPEHTIPMECNIHEVIDAIQVMGEGCHLIHKIGFAMCFSLAWTPSSMWNLHSTLFYDHLHAKFELQRALWHTYHQDAIERMQRGDDDVGYTCNGGIGELPPPHVRIDYLYATDHGASDYVRLHAVATAHKSEAVLLELAKHVPLNTFHVTLAPMIFAAARDAMPHSVKFMIERGAEINIMDAAEETPLDAARVALEFRMEMLEDHGQIVPVEEFGQVIIALREAGGASNPHAHEDAQHAFESMFGGGHGGTGDEDEEFEHDFGEEEEEEEGEEGEEDFGEYHAEESDDE
jgi:tetratricopeptide (TPR) repeat protein